MRMRRPGLGSMMINGMGYSIFSFGSLLPCRPPRVGQAGYGVRRANLKKCFVWEICGSLIHSNSGRKLCSRSRANHDRIFVMFQAPVARFSAVTVLLISAIPVSAQLAVVHEKDIVRAIVDQFDKSDLVGLGELHGSGLAAGSTLRESILRFARNQKPPQLVPGFVNEWIHPPDDLEAPPLNGVLNVNESQFVPIWTTLS